MKIKPMICTQCGAPINRERCRKTHISIRSLHMDESGYCHQDIGFRAEPYNPIEEAMDPPEEKGDQKK